MPTEPAIEISGPWTHRSVSANGTRFHVASCGDGPLVLLLHGFPEFWWTWRAQLESLAAAGYRAVAADLRGYGGSDKPPRGYDLITAAADAAGLIRALGEANAIVVGHDWGGLTAWSLASYFPKSVRRLTVVSMAHPLQLRKALPGSPLRISRSLRRPGSLPGTSRHGGYPLAFQLPLFPERQLVRDGAELVGSLLSSWSAPGWPDEETARIYQRAMRIPPVAHTALEYHRWFVRSAFRPDGLRYARHMRSPVAAPTLHLHGAVDPCVAPQTARGAGRYVEAPYRWKLIEGAGHYPHEERPDLFNSELLGWLSDPEPER
jgi:pimeloyl-ACP methyl ester carboxylesterase